MKVRYKEDLANHFDPESCAMRREAYCEALTGETGRPAIELRNHEIGMPTESTITEGNTVSSANRKPRTDPAQSETLCMLGSDLHRSWEVSAVPGAVKPGGMGKAGGRNPIIDAAEKSDTPIVPGKLPNKGKPAEAVEGRGVTKGNAGESPAGRTQSRETASMSLEGIREAAKRDRRMKFTALLHHVTPLLLVESFYDLKRQAAAGVDGVAWWDYEKTLYSRVHTLHREIHSGAYRVQPSRRVFIAKADGTLRPLGIAAIEDKVVQQAVVKMLSMIYEEDFLGFSYGFRSGRSQHDALDALTVGIKSHKVSWILDADIQAFFDTIDHEWMMRFLEHRIADRRVLRLIRKWLKAGVIEDGRRIVAEKGTPQGAVISPLLANIYLHYVLDLWAHQWRQRHAAGQVVIVRYADDCVVGFERRREAEMFLDALKERLNQFSLNLHAGKTRLIEFGRYAERDRQLRGEGKPETFDFLGFTHCCGRTRQGWFFVLRITVKRRMRATLKAIRAKLRSMMHRAIPEVGRWLGSVIRGYLNYFAVPGNIYRLTSFHKEVCRAWRQTLRRRSQRYRMSWQRFTKLEARYLPPYRTIHPYPEQRFRVKHPR